LSLKKAVVGNALVLGILQNGTLVTWGINQNPFFQSRIPSTYKNMLFKDVAASIASSFAVATNGNLYAWGDNTNSLLNIPVAARTGIKAVGAGARFVFAIKESDGSIIGWGGNAKGELPGPALTNVEQLDGGANHVVAVKSDGTLVAWGSNLKGQAAVPPGVTNAIQVSAGEDHSLALLSTGKVIAWGGNASFQISVPATLSNVISIAAGRYCSVALKSDGTVVAWGDSQYTTFAPRVTNGVGGVASEYNHSVVGLRNSGIAVAGPDVYLIYRSRTPTLTATP
jgi:alpha-tubulin suppressor-like RCC1 family protein